MVVGPLRWPVNLLSWAAVVYGIWVARLPGGQIVRSFSIDILIGLGIFWLIWPVMRILVGENTAASIAGDAGDKQRVTVGCALLLASF